MSGTAHLKGMDRAGLPVRAALEHGSAWRKGCIGGILTHVKGEPVLVVMRSDFKGRSVGIPKSRLHLYADEKTGMPTARLAAKAREIAQLLGVDTIDLNVTAIMDMVMFQADDLRKMENA